jgi:hypothetical protein
MNNVITIQKTTFSTKRFQVVVPNEHSPRFSTLKQATKYAQDLIENNTRFSKHNLTVIN